MNLKLFPSPLAGSAAAPVSKSAAHRLAICAALADRPTDILCSGSNADIDATLACLAALGASFDRSGDVLRVTPIGEPKSGGVLDCGESGSTERFLLPVACALGANVTLTGRGRLPYRPLAPLDGVLTAHGAILTPQRGGALLPLSVSGRLTPGDYGIDGGVSSQFVSGLLFALPMLDGPSRLRVTGQLESAPYVAMTLSALETFGLTVPREGNGFEIPKTARPKSPGSVRVEGDWSSAAFLLAAGAIGECAVRCTGLNPDSLQGDRAIFDILERFGAICTRSGDAFTVSPGRLHGTRVDGANIPDLIPILAVVAAFAEGESVFDNVARLRIKESDRIAAIRRLLSAMGIRSEADENRLVVFGGRPIGGDFDAQNDHRIAMSAAVAASAAIGPSTLTGAEAVGKSYPAFWEDFAALGGKFEVM